MLNDKLTLLIHSCQKFSDLWQAHTTLLNRNWADRNIRTFILTDEQSDQSFDGVEILSAGAGKEITERIRYALPLIETEYVLVTLDDYFPTTPISTEKIERLVDIMEREGYDYIRLFERPKCQIFATSDKDVFTYSLEGNYRVNLYAGIWRKDFIEKTLGDEEMNAWNFEVTLTERARKANGKCAVSHGDEFPILDVVRKGQILRKAHRYLKKHDLYHGPRPVRSVFDEFSLWIKTEGNRLVAKLPAPMYKFIQRTCMRLGMKSFSGDKMKSESQ